MTRYNDEDLVTFLADLRKKMLNYPQDGREQRVSFFQRLWTTLRDHEKL